MTKVFVVILNWNRFEDTLECLKSVSKLKKKNYELKVTVVDNASSDGSAQKLKKLKLPKFEFKVIQNKKSLGFAGGNNVGINDSLANGADYIMILNNDTLVDRNLVIELLEVVEKDPQIGAISPKIYFAPGFEFHKDRYDKGVLGKVIWYAGGKIDWKNVYGSTRGVDEVDNGKYDKVDATDFGTGTCLFLRTAALGDVGLFDEKYYLYYEDTELSTRLKRGGWKVYYAPDAIVWHKVSQSSGIGSELNDYYITRNRLLFGMKYAPIRAKLALIRESLKFLILGRKWQRIGATDFYVGNLGKGSWK